MLFGDANNVVDEILTAMLKLMTTRNVVLIVLLFASAAIGQELKPYRETPVELKVLSVRLMSPEKARRRQSDAIGIDVSVKLRLVNRGTEPVYFFSSWKDSNYPSGFTVVLGDRIKWIDGWESTTEKSPGLEHLTRLTDGGHWRSLKGGKAVEFEVFDATSSGPAQHAHTIFIKYDKKATTITEVLSDSYSLPKRDR